jgi:hypothetical protein
VTLQNWVAPSLELFADVGSLCLIYLNSENSFACAKIAQSVAQSVFFQINTKLVWWQKVAQEFALHTQGDQMSL